MRFITSIIVTLFILTSVSSAQNSGDISLGQIIGNSSNDSVGMGALSFNFIYSNSSTSFNIIGFTNGFIVYSPDGATWENLNGNSLNDFDGFDPLFTINFSQFNGINTDTIGFSGYTTDPVPVGMVPGYSDESISIYLELQSDDHGKTICIDSTFYNPSGLWQWGGLSPSDSLIPSWGGPYCFTIDECIGSSDSDSDGISDICDDCPNDPDNDIDGDGICGDIDNCPDNYNPNQEKLVLSSPSANELISSLSIFSWAPICVSSSYNIVLGQDSALTTILWSKDITNPSVTYDGPPLQPEQKYYWSVRAYLGAEYTSFVPSFSFNIDSPADTLDAPILVYPADNDSIVLPATFTWSPVIDAISYEIEYSLTNTFSTIEFSTTSVGATINMPNVFSVGIAVYWRAKAIDQFGFSGHYSSTSLFHVKSTIQIPNTPTTFVPDYLSYPDSIKFYWSKVNQVECYTVEFSTDPLFIDLSSSFDVDVCTGDTSLSLYWTGGTVIYWRVQACNSAGCSSWALGIGGDNLIAGGGIGCVDCPGESSVGTGLECIENAQLHTNENVIDIQLDNLYSLTASFFVSCLEDIHVEWLIDGLPFSTFNYGMIDDSIITLSSPLLPTSVVDNYTVSLKIFASSEFVTAGSVDINVTAPRPLPVDHLRISSSNATLLADGVSTALITVEVRDSLDNIVYSDNGRTIDLSTPTEGSLDNPSQMTTNGVVSFTYTAGTNESNVLFLASSTGFIDDSLIIGLNFTSLINLKNNFTLQMPKLVTFKHENNIGTPYLSNTYLTNTLWNFYNTRIDIATPTEADTSSLRRALLGVDVLLQNYNHPDNQLYEYDNDFTATYSQQHSSYDILTNLQSFLTPMVASADMIYKAIPDLPSELQQKYQNRLLELYNNMSMRLNMEYILLSDYPRNELKEVTDNMMSAIKDQIFLGTLMETVIIDDPISVASNDSLLSSYIDISQPMLTSISDMTVNNLFTGTYDDALSDYDSLLAIFKGSGNVVSNQYINLNIDSVNTYYIDKLNAIAGLSAQQRIYNALIISEEILSDNSYFEGMNLLGTYMGNMNDNLINFISVATGAPSPVQQSNKNSQIAKSSSSSIAYSPTNKNLASKVLASFVTLDENYEILVRAVLNDLKNSDFSNLKSNLDLIEEHNKVLSQTLKNVFGIVYSSANKANNTLTEFNTLYRDGLNSYTESSYARGLFDIYLAEFNEDTLDENARINLINQGNLALSSSEKVESNLDDIFEIVYTLESAPTLIVSSDDISADELFVETKYTLNFWILNYGSGTSVDSYVKIVGDGSSRVISGDSIFIGSIPSGDSVMAVAEVDFYDPVDFRARVNSSSSANDSTYGWSSISILPSNGNGLSISTVNSYGYQLSCCNSDRGNIDGGPDDGTFANSVDIADLIYLVTYMFKDGDEPLCMEEADINGSGGDPAIDISDLIMLVAFMFQGGDPPAVCQ